MANIARGSNLQQECWISPFCAVIGSYLPVQQVVAAKLRIDQAQASKAALVRQADELQTQHESLVDASGSNLDALGLQLSEASQVLKELQTKARMHAWL